MINYLYCLISFSGGMIVEGLIRSINQPSNSQIAKEIMDTELKLFDPEIAKQFHQPPGKLAYVSSGQHFRVSYFPFSSNDETIQYEGDDYDEYYKAWKNLEDNKDIFPGVHKCWRNGILHTEHNTSK